MDPGDGDGTCPECGERVPAGAARCPHCETDLDGSAVDLSDLDGSAVDLSDLDGLGDEGELADLVDVGPARQRASGSVRLVTGLAVSLPLAPLVLFLVGAAVSLSAPESVAVLVTGWLGPAVYLVRAPVPAVAFGRSLVLIAAGTALIPVALRYGGQAPTPVALDVWVVAVACLVLAAACLALGLFVARQARRGVGNPALDRSGSDE